jgi:hypothetical protein
MRLSRLLSKHSTDAANIQESNSVNYFNLCITIWKVQIFERTPAIRRGKSLGPFFSKNINICIRHHWFNRYLLWGSITG